MSETREHRIKRLRMRAMRRGIREMDLILTAWADVHLDALSDARLDLFDALLNENDHDLYQWVTGQVPPPGRYGGLIAEISQAIAK